MLPPERREHDRAARPMPPAIRRMPGIWVSGTTNPAQVVESGGSRHFPKIHLRGPPGEDIRWRRLPPGILFRDGLPRHQAGPGSLPDLRLGAGASLGALALQHRADGRAGSLRCLCTGSPVAGPADSPRLAAALVVLLGVILVLGPGAAFVGVIAGEAQDMATGVIRSPLVGPAPGAPGRPVRRRGPDRVGRVPPRGLDRRQRAGTHRHRHPARHPADYRLLRPVLSPARPPHSAGEACWPFIPFSHQECGATAGAFSGRHHLDSHRYGHDGRSAGAAGRAWRSGSPVYRMPCSGGW